VKNDAKLSVLRGFSKNDLLQIFASYQNASIAWKWAFRWQIILDKNVAL
jgi:hypothetical protein